MTVERTVMRWMEDGGPVMWLLLALSVAMVAAAIERAIALRRARTPVAQLLVQLRSALLGQPGVPAALAACHRAGGAVAAVVAAGLHAADRGEARVEKALEAAALAELRRLHRRLGLLATVAATAPLLGFLGTVTGMMASFDALVRHGMSDPGMVALGIKEALTTTAAGLIVALPAQMLHSAFVGQLSRIEGEMEAAANALLGWLPPA